MIKERELMSADYRADHSKLLEFDLEEWGNLYRSFNPELSGFVAYKAFVHEVPRSDVQDLTQETWYRFMEAVVLKKVKRIDHDLWYEAYLRRVALNLVRDRAKNRSAKKTIISENPSLESSIVENNPEGEAVLKADFKTFLKGLSESRAKVLMLAMIGFGSTETSRILNISVENSRTMLHRTRGKAKVLF